MARRIGPTETGHANTLDTSGRYVSRKLWIIVSLVLVGGLGWLLGTTTIKRLRAEQQLAEQELLAVEAVPNLAARRPAYTEGRLPSRTTFTQYLQELGLTPTTAYAMVEATRPIYNLAHVRAGNRVTLIRSAGKLRAVHYEIDPLHTLCITRESDGFEAHIESLHYKDKLAGIAGTIHGSLFQAVEGQGDTAELAVKIADIFSWNIDFDTDTQPGDTFAIVVDKRFLNGRFEGYGRILAAEYQSGHHDYQAILFRTPSGRPAYYQPSGKSMEKAFLRSPLKFAARITSGFSYHRFHPILRRYLPHLGIDYGAPVGSPVQAVADGTVLYAGWKGLDGKLVVLRHARGYQTYYMHLSRLLVHRGQRVRQGQTIALSGDTGLSTGPHLDFRIEQRGVFRNFLTLNLPPEHSVSRQDWKQFVRVRTRMLDELTALEPHPRGAEQAALLDAPGGQ
jgi:murein DD-endopeptidase MepM/ murein hydrolase activator NlpD